ncbi:uncharacterized protein METZ01_LOCUS345515 [marine metagenome]|uniref:Uncharacterized protein n=1 Tax=marine metagenome TaxID=408172 RepID=A0A382R7W1_9ZZZZ
MVPDFCPIVHRARFILSGEFTAESSFKNRPSSVSTPARPQYGNPLKAQYRQLTGHFGLHSPALVLECQLIQRLA